MAGRPKRILVVGLASLFAAGTVFGYAGCTAVQAAEERSERGGITLSDEECEIYDRLYDKIIKIASDGGSTSDMLSGKKMTMSWSYEELGLSSSASDSSCRTEALKALRTSLNKVRDALIAECPYELYWFDIPTVIVIRNGIRILCLWRSQISSLQSRRHISWEEMSIRSAQ